MPTRSITLAGRRWQVMPSGRITQYDRDEFALLFISGSGDDREVRVTRYSPHGTRSREQSLAELTARVQQNNKNRQASFRITDAVVFGDFLLPDRARVQSADVGIGLVRRQDSTRRDNSANATHSASEAQAERKFLRELRAKSAHTNLRPYADWMRSRTHRDLL